MPKEPGFVYALIPYERIATDAILEVWGISPKNEQKYQSAYIKAANETLRQSTAGMLEKVESTNSPNKESMKKVIAIVEAYQAKLREKGARFPAPLSRLRLSLSRSNRIQLSRTRKNRKRKFLSQSQRMPKAFSVNY